MIQVEIEIICTQCEEPLICSTRTRRGTGDMVTFVGPCRKCLSEAEHSGYKRKEEELNPLKEMVK